VTNDRDRQRSKVYAWEERFVAPRDPSSIVFAQAQGMVDAIWAEMGLRFPPKVEPLPRQARSMVADANRMLERQRQCIAKAKAAGKYKGRPPSIDRAKVRKLLTQMGPADVAKTMGVARSSVYRLIS